MEKLLEKQSPNLVEMQKTLVGLGNVLIQAGLSESISCNVYPSLGWLKFSCGDFSYEIDGANPYDEESYNSFVKSMEDLMKERISDYEKQIFQLECSKAIMELYFTDKKK